MSRRGIIILLSCLLLLLFGGWAANSWAEKRVVKELKAAFGEGLQYDELHMDLLQGKLALKGMELDLNNFRLEAKQLAIIGFGYYEFLSSDHVSIRKIEITGPEAHFFTQRPDTSETSRNIKREVSVQHFEVREGTLHIAATDSTAQQLYTEIKELHLMDIQINEESLQKKLPFQFETYELAVDSLFLEVDGEHYLTLGDLQIKDQALQAQQLQLIPKYSKAEFQKHIPYEKDRFQLYVERLSLDSLQWGFENDSLYVKNNLLRLEGPRLQVYRNKLVRDDLREKTLYAEKIRNLPFKLELETVELKAGEIVYEELTREEAGPALVNFTRVYAVIHHLTNFGMKEEDFPTTEAVAEAYLMGESKIDFQLNFKVNDLSNRYHFKGNAAALSKEGINSFLKPALNIEAEGGIESLAFDFSGNDEGAGGDMKLQYRDFSIKVLRDDGKKKDGILSAIANLFISNKALDEDAVREDLEVERDKTKSFWNLVWSCIEKGAIKSLL